MDEDRKEKIIELWIIKVKIFMVIDKNIFFLKPK